MYVKIPEHILEEIQERISLAELIGQYVELKRAGRNWKGVCPFHKETAPSFSVNDEEGFYYCFGCNAHGRAIQFLMAIENLSFPEAVRQLAERAGVELPQAREMTEQDRRTLSEKERIYEANLLAAEYFEQQLIRGDVGLKARNYLQKRGISDEMVRVFHLGYALDAWDGLEKALQKKGVSSHVLEKAGLILQGKRGGMYDRFRNRLMFPIIMQNNRVIGFGGRTLDVDESAKYINSSASPVYDKSRSLFGYHAARANVSRKQRAILVEGNVDVVMMHQHGFDETMASLGTALTDWQIRLLKRMSKNLILLYDGDAAGKKAMFKSLDLFLSESVNARAVMLPDGHDPDSFLRDRGQEAMEERISGAEYLFDIWLSDRYTQSDKDPRGVSEFLNEVGPMLMKIADPVERTLYVEQIAGKLGIGQPLILQTLRRQTARKNWERAPSEAVIRKTKSGESLRNDAVEDMLIGLLIHNPESVSARFSADNTVNRFKSPAFREIANALLDSLENGERIHPEKLLGRLSTEEEKKRFGKIVFNKMEYLADEAVKHYKGCLVTLELIELEEEIDRMKTEMARSDGADRSADLIELYRKLQDLKSERINHS